MDVARASSGILVLGHCTQLFDVASTDKHARINAVLVESVRVDGKPRQKHIAFLGSLSIDRIGNPPDRFWYDVATRLNRGRRLSRTNSELRGCSPPSYSAPRPPRFDRIRSGTTTLNPPPGKSSNSIPSAFRTCSTITTVERRKS